MLFERGTFWVLPLTYFHIPQRAWAYLFPQSVKIHYFCSGPISVDPICPQATETHTGFIRGFISGFNFSVSFLVSYAVACLVSYRTMESCGFIPLSKFTAIYSSASKSPKRSIGRNRCGSIRFVPVLNFIRFGSARFGSARPIRFGFLFLPGSKVEQALALPRGEIRGARRRPARGGGRPVGRVTRYLWY